MQQSILKISALKIIEEKGDIIKNVKFELFGKNITMRSVAKYDDEEWQFTIQIDVFYSYENCGDVLDITDALDKSCAQFEMKEFKKQIKKTNLTVNEYIELIFSALLELEIEY